MPLSVCLKSFPKFLICFENKGGITFFIYLMLIFGKDRLSKGYICPAGFKIEKKTIISLVLDKKNTGLRKVIERPMYQRVCVIAYNMNNMYNNHDSAILKENIRKTF